MRPDPVYLALGLSGFVTLLGQIVFLRKGIASFSGNELGLAIGLLCWLVWVGAGGLLLRRLAPSVKDPLRLFYASLLLLAILFPVTQAAMELARLAFGIPVGLIVSLPFIAVAYACVLLPFCLVDGAAFGLGASAAGKTGISRAFAAECAGAVLGGVFFQFAVRRLPGYGLAAVVVVVVGGAVCLLARKDRSLWAAAAAVLALGLALAVGGGRILERAVGSARWAGFSVRESSETPQGSMTWAVRSGADVMFYDGTPLLSAPDPRTAEQAAGPGLFVHEDPRKILVVTSRATGLLEKVLAHPVSSVDLVLLDPDVLGSESRWMPETRRAVIDPRVRTAPSQARSFLRQAGARQAERPYDVVLLDLPDPDTLQFNRFYTVEFFRLVAAVLARDGVLAISAGEPANYITPTQARYLACIDATLGEASFAFRSFYPLGRYSILASRRPLPALTADLADKVVADRTLDYRYMTGATLAADLSTERVGKVREAVSSAGRVPANRDLRPVLPGLRLLLWAERLGEGFVGRILWSFVRWGVLAALAVAALLLAVASARGSGGAPLLLLGGYSAMSVELAVLYLYQAAYGYLYSAIAALLALHMVGIAIGAASSTKPLRPATISWIWVAVCLGCGGASGAGILNMLPERMGLAAAGTVIALAGVLAGVSFARGSGDLAEGGHPAAGGTAYGVDLLGAAAGSVVSGLVLPLAAGLVAPLIYGAVLAAAVGAGAMARRGKG